MFVRKLPSAIRSQENILKNFIGITSITQSLEVVTKQLEEVSNKVQTLEQAKVAGGDEAKRIFELAEVIRKIQTEITSSRETVGRISSEIVSNVIPTELPKLNEKQLRILKLLLDHKEPLSFNEITQHLRVHRNTALTLIDIINERTHGLVQRTGNNYSINQTRRADVEDLLKVREQM